jgi:3-hydroxyisobutyrate dehydrogenase
MARNLKLGYVGVGLMGGPMVKRLCGLGWRVRAYDVVAARCEAARADGAEIASSAADAARGADVVLLNLPTIDAVEQAMFGANGVVEAAKAPQLVVDFSTIKVDTCRAFAQRLREAGGGRWVDAPVSGGPPAVASGTLTVMAGGEAEDLARIAELMKDIGGRCTRMGPTGAGLAAKMINQLIVGVGQATLAEAEALAETAGIDAARIPECLSGGYADGPMLHAYWPRMVERDYAPRGYVRQLLKDLEMVNDWAGGMKAPVPLMGLALQQFRTLYDAG